MPSVEFDHRIDDGIEKIAIMGTEQDSRFAVAEVFFQPKDRLFVEMVRRFIHDEEVAGHNQRPGQAQTFALAAGQVVNGFRKVRNPQFAEDDFGFRLQFPGLLAVHFGTEGDDGFVISLLNGFFILPEELHDGQIAVEYTLKNRVALYELRFLWQIMDARLGIEPQRAAVHIGQAGNDFEEGRLPRPIETDESQFLPAVDGEGYAVEEDPQTI